MDKQLLAANEADRADEAKSLSPAADDPFQGIAAL